MNKVCPQINISKNTPLLILIYLLGILSFPSQSFGALSCQAILETHNRKETKTKQKFSKQTVIDLILILDKHMHISPSNVKALTKNDLIKISPKFESFESGEEIYKLVRAKFGWWKKGLLEAGLDGSKSKVPARFSDQVLIESIQILAKKINPSTVEVTTLTKSDLKEISKELSIFTNGRSLVTMAYRRFGSWDNFLLKAGLDPVKIRKTVTISDDELINTVKILGKEINPSYTEVMSLTKEDLLKISKELSVYPNGEAIYKRARMRFGWDETLVKAGFDPIEIKRNIVTVSDADLIKAVKILGKEMNLSYTEMVSLTKKDLLRISKKLRAYSNGRYIYEQGRMRFGWDETLVKAGLEPEKIRKIGLTDYKNLTYEGKVRRTRNVENKDRFLKTAVTQLVDDDVVSVIVDSTSIESEIHRDSFNQKYDNLLDSLGERDRYIFESMLKTIEKLNEAYVEFNLPEIISDLVENQNITSDEIQKLILKISKDKELFEAFQDYISG